MKKLLVGSIAALAIPFAAQAADLPAAPVYKAPVVAPPPLTWNGCYIGANAGGILGWDQYSLAMGGDFLTNPNNIFSIPSNNAQLAHSYTSTASGFTGGGQIGCNWQTGPAVWGVEADLNGATRLTDTNSFGPAGPFVNAIPANLLAASHTETVTKDLDWFSTFRGRLGFLATPTLLLYGTGGLAVAQIDSSTNLTFEADQFFLHNFGFSGSETLTSWGWTVGGGAEWMFAPNWSLKAEYLYLDFGSFAYNSPCTGPVIPGSCPVGTNHLWTTNVRAREQIARVGVNYHFDWGRPVVARY